MIYNYKTHMYTNVSYRPSHLSTVSKRCNLFSHHSPDQTSDTVRQHRSNTMARAEELLKTNLTNKIHLIKKKKQPKPKQKSMGVFCLSISSVFQTQDSETFSFFYKDFNLCWNDCMRGKTWHSYKSHKISYLQTVLLNAALKS